MHYPGIEAATLPLAGKQMPDGFGPLLSFELDGSAADADAVVAASRLILPATSFGGVESTRERRARWAGETAPPSLIRLSAGIEPLSAIVADIGQALKVA
jgi:cystathionine beta-lyase/cystathionine gamma-synthase